MKTYIKPSCEWIDLRTEERFAQVTSGCLTECPEDVIKRYQDSAGPGVSIHVGCD